MSGSQNGQVKMLSTLEPRPGKRRLRRQAGDLGDVDVIVRLGGLEPLAISTGQCCPCMRGRLEAALRVRGDHHPPIESAHPR